MNEITGRTLGDHVVMRTDLSPELWNCRIDPTQAEVALLNVLLNARDAMPGGGTVTIKTENLTIDDEMGLLLMVRPGPYAVVQVQDTGLGMPAEILARVMEPFFTTKEEGRGTGLGLAMVYGFAKQSGGTVRITSEVGQRHHRAAALPGHRPGRHRRAPPGAAGRRPQRHRDHPGGRRPGGRRRHRQGDPGGFRLHGARRPRRPAGARPPRREREGRPPVLRPDHAGRHERRAPRPRRPRAPAPHRVLLTTGYAEASIERTDAGGSEFEIINKPYRRMELARRVRLALDGPTGVG